MMERVIAEVINKFDQSRLQLLDILHVKDLGDIILAYVDFEVDFFETVCVQEPVVNNALDCLNLSPNETCSELVLNSA